MTPISLCGLVDFAGSIVLRRMFSPVYVFRCLYLTFYVVFGGHAIDHGRGGPVFGADGGVGNSSSSRGSGGGGVPAGQGPSIGGRPLTSRDPHTAKMLTQKCVPGAF